MKRPFVYICSPYRGDTGSNELKAREYCRIAYDAGYPPIARPCGHQVAEQFRLFGCTENPCTYCFHSF